MSVSGFYWMSSFANHLTSSVRLYLVKYPAFMMPVVWHRFIESQAFNVISLFDGRSHASDNERNRALRCGRPSTVSNGLTTQMG